MIKICKRPGCNKIGVWYNRGLCEDCGGKQITLRYIFIPNGLNLKCLFGLHKWVRRNPPLDDCIKCVKCKKVCMIGESKYNYPEGVNPFC